MARLNMPNKVAMRRKKALSRFKIAPNGGEAYEARKLEELKRLQAKVQKDKV